MKTLTDEQAYAAMFYFLERYWEREKSDEIAMLLGGMSILQDGGTADPAYLQDWNEAVEFALNGGQPGQLMLGNKK